MKLKLQTDGTNEACGLARDLGYEPTQKRDNNTVTDRVLVSTPLGVICTSLRESQRNLEQLRTNAALGDRLHKERARRLLAIGCRHAGVHTQEIRRAATDRLRDAGFSPAENIPDHVFLRSRKTPSSLALDDLAAATEEAKRWSETLAFALRFRQRLGDLEPWFQVTPHSELTVDVHFRAKDADAELFALGIFEEVKS